MVQLEPLGLHPGSEEGGKGVDGFNLDFKLDAINNMVGDASEKIEEARGGIEAIRSLFFSACGTINKAANGKASTVVDTEEESVFFLDDNACSPTAGRNDCSPIKFDSPTKRNDGWAARDATPPKKDLGVLGGGGGGAFSSPDRAAGLPVGARREGSRLHPNIPRAPTTSATQKFADGATNELHRIAKAGDWKRLRACLTNIMDHSKTINAAGQVDEKGRTPLMLACARGAAFPPDVARLLLVANNQSASVYVLQKNNGRQYCLHVATSCGCSIEVLSILHGAYPKAANAVDGNGNMPLHLAVNNGRYRSIVGQIDERGEDIASTVISDCNVNVELPKPGHSFHSLNVDTASKQSSSSPSYDIDSESLCGASVSTSSLPGHSAGSEDDMVNACEFLISANQSALLHRNRRGETPLLLAIYRRSPSDVLSLLLVRGGAASLKIADDFGSYPLHFCDRSPSLSLVKDMAQLYPDAIVKKNKLGNTPLYSAMISSCGISVLRTMLECCTKPRETVESKNGDNINAIRFGWDDLTTQKVVAAEDQDEEDRRLEDCKNLISHASSPSDIMGTYLGDWWAKATLLLQAAYHNTIVSDENKLFKGRKWMPVHAVAGTECPIEMVKFVLQIYSEQAGSVDENLNTPLHIGASRPDIISIETITLLLEAHPSSAMMQNNEGFSPLHIACLYKAPLEVLELLLRTSPDATCLRNKAGQTALFIAISVGSSVDVLRALLEAKPSSVHIRDENGTSSIALAWLMLLSGKVFEERGTDAKSESKRSNTNISSLAIIMRSSSLKGDVRAWMGKIDLLLRAAFHGTVSDTLPKGRQWRAVHAAAAAGVVPPDLLAFALQILPSEAGVANESKEYPLHIAASAPPHEANCPPQLGPGDSIELLLKTNIVAVKKADRRGRLPLHLALNSGKTWHNGIKSLVDCFPESTRMRDPVTMLYPFMLAGVRQSSNSLRATEETDKPSVDLVVTNTIFMLLQAAPEMILLQESDAEIAFLRRSRWELLVEKEELKEKLKVTEAALHKRMSTAELKAIEDAEKRENSRQQEELRRQRAQHLEQEVRQSAKTLSFLAASMMSLKDEGLY